MRLVTHSAAGFLSSLVLSASAPSLASPQDSPRLVAAASEYIDQSRWTVREGLVQQTVTDIRETRDGYLWMTTFGGLARFDGVRFHSFTLADTPALGSNKLLSLYEDRAGRLWIGTADAGVVCRDGTTFRAFRQGVPRVGVQDFAEDAGGVLHVAGTGLSRLVERDGVELFEPVTEPGWLPTTEVSDLLTASDGTLWAATKRGLLRNAGDGFEVVDDGELACATRGLVEDRLGRIWLASATGIAFLQDDGPFLVAPLDETVYSAALDAHGDLLVGVDSGLLRQPIGTTGIAPLAELSIPFDDESLESGVTSLWRDSQQNIWVGTNAFGLLRIAKTPFAQFEDRRGLQRGSVLRMVDDRRGGVWVQGMAGWIQHGDGVEFRSPAPDSVLATPGIELVGSTRAGVLWLRGGDRAYAVTETRLGWTDAVLFEEPIGAGLVEAEEGRLWFGGQGRLHSYRDGAFERHDLAGVDGDVRLHLRARDGSLWFSGRELLGRTQVAGERDVLELFRHEDGLPYGEVRDLHEDSNGTLWITTYGSGLARFADGRFTYFGEEQGLVEQSLGGMLEDDQGRLWVNSNVGLLILSLEELDRCARGELSSVPCRVLGSPETNGPHRVRDALGRMWFPTVRGAVVADPHGLSPNPAPPVVHVESVEVDGAAVDLANGVVPAGAQSITIEYTGLSLRNPEQVRFRYRLEGYQDGWVEARTRRTAYFTKVPPGDYVFHVTAANADGVWGQTGARLPLTVAAHFHQTTWFRVFGVLVLAAFVWGLHRYRVTGIERLARALRNEIDSRERAEQLREQMERSLLESSKLEAVGRLAGGIAHDFNNVLTAILGRAELLREDLGQQVQRDDAVQRERLAHVEGITECGERAAALTRQLLAFGRQQMLLPQVLDANAVVERLEPMLRQLLPENIELTTRLRRGLAPICVDPSQLEQVVMNLVLNARDAMPRGGEILIETSLARLDHAYVERYSQARLGEHVWLCVSDTGEGMSTEVLAHVFEPFFTTKEPGRGTGLGLASVHGIVVQSGGHVRVDSRPGRGSTFHVYLPASSSERPPASPATDDRAMSVEGSERLLLCEDDEAIRTTMGRALRLHGYDVLVASRPSEALEVARREQEIDLLITDVMLPQQNGRELAREFALRHARARVLYVSGYTDDVLGDEERGDELQFLQKPFTPKELLRRVRGVLDAAVRAS